MAILWFRPPPIFTSYGKRVHSSGKPSLDSPRDWTVLFGKIVLLAERHPYALAVLEEVVDSLLEQG